MTTSGQILIDVQGGITTIRLANPQRRNAISTPMWQALGAFAAGAGFDEAATLAAAKTRLTTYKVPKRILTVNEIPRNRMSKVLKAELRANYRNLFVPLKT